MPTVRSIYWPALVPQAIVLIGLSALTYLLWPRLEMGYVLLAPALAYLLGCRFSRSIIARDYRAGMQAYRAQRFDEAIAHFEASRAFFEAHPLLDACRPWYGIASANSYRDMSLCSLAYCCAQVGQTARAIELFEEALRLNPNHINAQFGLRMLRAGAGSSNAGTHGA